MKKVLLAVALFMALSFGARAQYFEGGNDNFFNDIEDYGNGINRDIIPGVPGSHGGTGDISAPLGSGLVILTALGAGYALRRKNEE